MYLLTRMSFSESTVWHGTTVTLDVLARLLKVIAVDIKIEEHVVKIFRFE